MNWVAVRDSYNDKNWICQRHINPGYNIVLGMIIGRLGIHMFMLVGVKSTRHTLLGQDDVLGITVLFNGKENFLREFL